MLSNRSATVLNVLVDEYLHSATPVASDEIARAPGQERSSATFHNNLARLTEDGYIFRRHMSSGDVRSDSGVNSFKFILGQCGALQRFSGAICIIRLKRMGYGSVHGGAWHLSDFMHQMVYGIRGNSAY